MTHDNGQIRQFSTGATRDTSQNKLEPYGFISPLALFRFSEYMHKHRLQADGSLRSSDNWKKGIPIMVYVHSLIRHVFDFWLVMSGLKPRFDPKVTDPVEIACAIMFNVQGFLHEAMQKADGLAPIVPMQGLTMGVPIGDIPGDQLVDRDLSDEVDRAFDRMTSSLSPDVVIGTVAPDAGWLTERAWR